MGVDFNVVVVFKTNQTSLGLNYVSTLLEAINFLLEVLRDQCICDILPIIFYNKMYNDLEHFQLDTLNHVQTLILCCHLY
jgi:hypothetical protein